MENMKKNNKVLLVVTNISEIPGTTATSGFFMREMTHPYFELHEAGYTSDIASIKGGTVQIDPHSDPRNPHSMVKDDMISIGFINSPRHAVKLDKTIKLSEAKLNEYDAIFFAGGGAAIFDMPFSDDVSTAIRIMWETGKIVSAVCHGVGALLNVRLSNGEYLVAGKDVTGYTTEEDNNIAKMVPGFKPPIYIDEDMKLKNARFSSAPVTHGYAVTSKDGRLVTGQNNKSGTIVGKHLVAALQGTPLDRDMVERA
jgi:putative intracellular protease/amidase